MEITEKRRQEENTMVQNGDSPWVQKVQAPVPHIPQRPYPKTWLLQLPTYPSQFRFLLLPKSMTSNALLCYHRKSGFQLGPWYP